MGNDLAVLIIEARQKCYRNDKTGEVRNWFYSTLGDLGQALGFGPKKISRILKSRHAESFIRYKPTYFYNPELEKRVKGKCQFKVALDDPLTPEDEARLIYQDVHKGESFKEQPKGKTERKNVSLQVRPRSQAARIKYSTYEKIKESEVIVSNHTRSEKEEKSSGTTPRQSDCKESEEIFENLLKSMRQESAFAQGILSQCTIAEVHRKESLTTFVIDTPNYACRVWLERNYSMSIAKTLERHSGARAHVKFASKDD